MGVVSTSPGHHVGVASCGCEKIHGEVGLKPWERKGTVRGVERDSEGSGERQ